MSKTEFTVRIIAKLLLVTGAIMMFAAGCMVNTCENSAIPIALCGALMSVPDLVIWWIDGLYIDKE